MALSEHDKSDLIQLRNSESAARWLLRFAGLRDAFIRRYLRPAVLLAAVIFLAFIWTFTYSRIRLEKQIVFEAAIADSRNLSNIIALNLEQILNRAELYAQVSASYLEARNVPPSVLKPGLTGDRTYLRIAVFDLHGELLFSSASRPSEPEMQPVVEQLRNADDPAGMAMVIGKTGDGTAAWRVPIALPVNSSTGERIGFLAAVLDLGYFLQLYQGLDLGESGSLGIFTNRGVQLVELSESTLSTGPNFSGAAYGGLLSSDFPAGVILPRQSDGKLQDIGSFQFVGYYPLAVTVIRHKDGVLKNFYQRRQSYVVWATIFSAIVMLMLSGLAALIRRQQKLLLTVTRSEREKKKLIGALESEKSRAYQLASHDYLTGIPNRMLFNELARAELSRAKRSRNVYALLFLDLNKFKLINDTLGHAVGDLLLQAVAQRLRQSVRSYDLVSRLGGDEFVVLLSEMRSEKHISDIAEKIIAAISEPYKNLNGHDVEISTSIGIARYPRDGANIDMLLLHADAAMYQAKSRGAGKYCFYDAMLQGLAERHLDLLSRFRTAIKENEFRLYYQPKINLQTFEVCGLEALVRWQHPKHGLLSPGEFIGLAERNDLIDPLGAWIIDEACRQIAEWERQGLAVPPVAINISAKQLRDDTLIDMFCTAMQTHGIPAEKLEIEITESCLIEDMDTARELLDRLHDAGIRISIDDYGTGFSGLSNLKRLPIYAVKIDKSFITDLRNDVDDAMIVAYTISLAHNLGLVVVAEGVETKEQVVHLKTAGCDQVQGYYFQKPLPAVDIVAILREGMVYPEKNIMFANDDTHDLRTA